MRVDIIGTAAEVTDERVSGKQVAVIDVFRATSVIVTALENGAREIIPVTDVQECFRLKEELTALRPNEKIVLGGERKTELIEGFDLDNSPLKYSPEAVDGATIIMSTTNGTRAVNCARGAAEKIYIAALLNADAVAEAMGKQQKDIVLVCSGRHDRFTVEDGLCAGMMAHYLSAHHGYEPTDFAWWCADLYQRWQDDLRGALENCRHYRDIRDRWAEDIEWCLGRNQIQVVPLLNDKGGITL